MAAGVIEIAVESKLPALKFAHATRRGLHKCGKLAVTAARHTTGRASKRWARALDYEVKGLTTMRLKVKSGAFFWHMLEGGTKAHVVRPRRLAKSGKGWGKGKSALRFEGPTGEVFSKGHRVGGISAGGYMEIAMMMNEARFGDIIIGEIEKG